MRSARLHSTPLLSMREQRMIFRNVEQPSETPPEPTERPSETTPEPTEREAKQAEGPTEFVNFQGGQSPAAARAERVADSEPAQKRLKSLQDALNTASGQPARTKVVAEFLMEGRSVGEMADIAGVARVTPADLAPLVQSPNSTLAGRALRIMRDWLHFGMDANNEPQWRLDPRMAPSVAQAILTNADRLLNQQLTAETRESFMHALFAQQELSHYIFAVARNQGEPPRQREGATKLLMNMQQRLPAVQKTVTAYLGTLNGQERDEWTRLLNDTLDSLRKTVDGQMNFLVPPAM